MTNRMRLGLVCGATLALMAGLATGAAPSEKGGSQDVLKGPSAEPGGPPTSPGVFGDPSEARPGRPAANSRAKYELFQRALGTLMREDAPGSLRLTAEQQEKVRTIQHEFRQANEAFFREHQEEIRKIREQTGDKAPGGPRERVDAPGKDGKGAPMDRKGADRPGQGKPGKELSAQDREELMARLRALEEKRPDPGPFQARVWESLRADQRAHLTKEIERHAEEIAKRRGEERLQKEREERSKSPGNSPGNSPGKSPDKVTDKAPGKAPAGKGADKAPGERKEKGDQRPGQDGARGSAEQAERLAQRLQITPEQAKQLVARLSAPASAEERGLSPEQRIERRVNAVPESVLPASKRGALKQMLASRAQDRGGERGGQGKAAPKKDRKGDEAPAPTVDDVKVPRP